MKDFLNYFGARKYRPTQGYLAEWIAQRIKEDKRGEAVGILKVWAYSTRREECTTEKIKELNEMTNDEVVMALKVLEEPPILKRIGDKQLDIQVKITTTNTEETFCKKALVDSGCSTFCISQKFVKENCLNTQKLPFPVTCYNADGSANRDGSVTEMVQVRIAIGDHQELIQLLVTNISNHNLFLDHNWLQKHNLSINWKESAINLDKCQQ